MMFHCCIAGCFAQPKKNLQVSRVQIIMLFAGQGLCESSGGPLRVLCEFFVSRLLVLCESLREVSASSLLVLCEAFVQCLGALPPSPEPTYHSKSGHVGIFELSQIFSLHLNFAF